MHAFGNVVHHIYLRLHLQLFTNTLFSKIIKFVTNYVSSFCVYFAFNIMICALFVGWVASVCLIVSGTSFVLWRRSTSVWGEGGGGTGVTYFVRLSGGGAGGGGG